MLFDSEPTQLESRGGDRNGDFVSIDSKAFSGEDDTRGPGEGGGEGGLSSSLSYGACEDADTGKGLLSR